MVSGSLEAGRGRRKGEGKGGGRGRGEREEEGGRGGRRKRRGREEEGGGRGGKEEGEKEREGEENVVQCQSSWEAREVRTKGASPLSCVGVDYWRLGEKMPRWSGWGRAVNKQRRRVELEILCSPGCEGRGKAEGRGPQR